MLSPANLTAMVGHNMRALTRYNETRCGQPELPRVARAHMPAGSRGLAAPGQAVSCPPPGPTASVLLPPPICPALQHLGSGAVSDTHR